MLIMNAQDLLNGLPFCLKQYSNAFHRLRLVHLKLNRETNTVEEPTYKEHWQFVRIGEKEDTFTMYRSEFGNITIRFTECQLIEPTNV